MNWRARSALIFCLGLVAAIAAAPDTRAADFPARAIKLVIPYAAGGPTDIFGRLLAEYLGKDLKQAVYVENKAGAQGAIGAEMVARAEPDGYTLFGTSGSVLILNPLLYKKLSYDPAKDFRMLALVTEVPVVLCVHPSVPAKTIAEFVAYARQNPGKLNFGSSGTGKFYPSCRRDVQADGRHRDDPYRLQGRGSGAHRCHVRQDRADVRIRKPGAAADTIRNAAAAWHQFATATCRSA